MTRSEHFGHIFGTFLVHVHDIFGTCSATFSIHFWIHVLHNLPVLHDVHVLHGHVRQICQHGLPQDLRLQIAPLALQLVPTEAQPGEPFLARLATGRCKVGAIGSILGSLVLLLVVCGTARKDFSVS